MKHSDFRHIFTPAMLMWLYPLLLVAPNVLLCITEGYATAACVANVLLPLGVYMLMCTVSRKIGRTVLLCTPFSVYAAFQIVLFYLYGESIIAIDMFLNVATTNFGEATELLANLSTAICVVVALYLPPIIWAIVLVCSHSTVRIERMSVPRRIALTVALLGLVSLFSAYATDSSYSARRQLFPLNVIDNTAQAVIRYHATGDYHETSAAFRYFAKSTRPASEREIYVLIIGETCRADNWQLTGYSRPTNPKLSQRHDVIAFPHVLSESNTTHKSVPLLMSPLTAENFGDSIYYVRSVFDAFNEAGYSTAFFSNQQHNGSFIDFFGQQADTCCFIADTPGALRSDRSLLPMLRDFIEGSAAHKLFIVLHSYGSHFSYRERYPDDCRLFQPDNNDSAERRNRAQLLNAYDNSIVNTDALIDGVINRLLMQPAGTSAAMLFVPDHGEDIFDDDRERFLHASPVPTYWQIHVPMLLWMSPEYRDMHPTKANAAEANINKNISSSRSVFDTLLSLAGIRSPHAALCRAVTEPAFTEEPRMYLNDYNEGVALSRAGLHEEDLEMFAAKSIDI